MEADDFAYMLSNSSKTSKIHLKDWQVHLKVVKVNRNDQKALTDNEADGMKLTDPAWLVLHA